MRALQPPTRDDASDYRCGWVRRVVFDDVNVRDKGVFLAVELITSVGAPPAKNLWRCVVRAAILMMLSLCFSYLGA
jgi:hypothetical protein